MGLQHLNAIPQIADDISRTFSCQWKCELSPAGLARPWPPNSIHLLADSHAALQGLLLGSVGHCEEQERGRPDLVLIWTKGKEREPSFGNARPHRFMHAA